jgi:5-methyltetrahydropteroyltriglutamate--homocysteine methyltransferase
MTSTPSALPILPTFLVGNHAQPDWLIDRAKLAGDSRLKPRFRVARFDAAAAR